MDVLSPFISVLCRSDWLFHGESCPRIDVVHPWPCVVFLACVHLALFLALSLQQMTLAARNYAIRLAIYDFLLVCLHFVPLPRCDMASYCSIIAIFFTHVYFMPALGMPSFELNQDLRCRKTDRRTEGRTDWQILRHGIYVR